MHMALALALQRKPLAGVCYERGSYQGTAVVEAMNALRIHEHAQLVSYASVDYETDIQKARDAIEQARKELEGLTLANESLSFQTEQISSTAFCLGIVLSTEQE